jgi:hypothetical protein
MVASSLVLEEKKKTETKERRKGGNEVSLSTSKRRKRRKIKGVRSQETYLLLSTFVVRVVAPTVSSMTKRGNGT